MCDGVCSGSLHCCSTPVVWVHPGSLTKGLLFLYHRGLRPFANLNYSRSNESILNDKTLCKSLWFNWFPLVGATRWMQARIFALLSSHIVSFRCIEAVFNFYKHNIHRKGMQLCMNLVYWWVGSNDKVKTCEKINNDLKKLLFENLFNVKEKRFLISHRIICSWTLES